MQLLTRDMMLQVQKQVVLTNTNKLRATQHLLCLN